MCPIVSDLIPLKVEFGECLREEKKMDMREMNRDDGSPCSVLMLQLELVPHCLLFDSGEGRVW